MRIGIISDIHANLEALTASLNALDHVGIDTLVCLGDVVGYGAEPNACCDLVRSRAQVTILGNHDAAASGRMDYSFYRAPARHVLDLHARTLSAENLAWLRSLPLQAEVGEVALCHGSPAAVEDFEYIFVTDQVRELQGRFDEFKPVTFLGHSHLCKAFSFTRTEAREILHTRFDCDADRRYIITVGSVGQPRDYDNRACCGVYDTGTRRFEYVRAGYDIDAAAQKIYDAQIAVAFGKRLYLGV